MISTNVRRGYLVLAVATVAVYFVVPASRMACVAVLGGAAVGAIAFGVRRWHPQRGLAWLILASGVLLLVLSSEWVLASNSLVPQDYPTVADILALAAFLPLATGLLLLGQPRLPSRDWIMVLDTIGLSLAGSLFLWLGLIRPAVLDLHLGAAGRIVAVVSWVGYVAVLAAAVRVLLVWRANPALVLLGVSMAALLISDFAYAKQLENGTFNPGGIGDLGFLSFLAIIGFAALLPSMAKLVTAPYAGQHLGIGQLLVLVVGLLAAPTAVMVEATPGPIGVRGAIAIVGAAVGLLTLARLVLTARAFQVRAAREHALRLAGRTLVETTTESQVMACLNTAVATMVQHRSLAWVHLRNTDAARVTEPRIVASANKPGLGELAVSTRGPATITLPDSRRVRRQFVFTGEFADLAELSPDLQAMADQAGAAIERIDLVHRLRAEERERYFRTLVLTSTDATLITRDGRIDYATPSAVQMFGRDVHGEIFDDVVSRATDSASAAPWTVHEDDAEGVIERGVTDPVAVVVQRRDLTDDPTVSGVVSTLRDVSAERRLRDDLAYRASHDALTGLSNAHAFGDELRGDDAIDAERRGSPGGGRAALFIDLDDFKSVNDTFGHEVGDLLLTEVAERIRSCLRESDLAARLGGDEFAVLLRGGLDERAAQSVAQRVVDALASPIKVRGIPLNGQASVGLAYAPRRGNLDTLLRHADAALYTAKARGKGRWWQWREGMVNPTRRNVSGGRRLQEAIDSGDLTVHYQPIVELASGRAVGFEALIRLDDPDNPMTPKEIIDTAEETGLITALGNWVLDRALGDVRVLNPPGSGPTRYVSVNVSAHQLRQPDFVDMVVARLRTAGVAGSQLVLEITESLLIADDDRAWDFLGSLREHGVRIAIDDYGTGYASLNYLRKPIVDVVKIDKSFLDDLSSPRSRTLLDAVTSLCRNLGLEQVAEGVADARARSLLLQFGCKFGQGFLYARAMPPAEAGAWQIDRTDRAHAA